ncbi:hypothetical protein EPO04_02290 [Patescibacteria group bacterium]|nr:MAG: hypothetical protein EPO04_02290 [Patescibacteria group bacterium]
MERLNNSAEQNLNSTEIEQAAAERLKNLERSAERITGPEDGVEAAREKLRQAERQSAQTERASIQEDRPKAQPISLEANYRHTMTTLQHRLKPASRTFSKVIHSPVVERTSEVVGSTIARPSVTVGATGGALIFSTTLYLYARYYGFTLKGSEIWIGLLVGGVIGLVAEFSLRLLRGRRSS